MNIDFNEFEMEAMDCFKCGDTKKAQLLQARFLEDVKDSGNDYCTCPGACKYHGKCVDCVVIHRGHGDHLPHCFQLMVNKRINSLSELTEHSYLKQNE